MAAPPSYEQATGVQPPQPQNSGVINFTLNGVPITVDPTYDKTITTNTMLAEFIRTRTSWTGTKIACNEGGCGACTVAATFYNPAGGETVTRALNACIRPLLSLDGFAIVTNDALTAGGVKAAPGVTVLAPAGNATGNHHEIQKRLAANNGSQCGYCSNGMVMTMYSMLCEAKARGNKNLTPLDIEHEFDGNLCRCTGYRPIMEAMKTFATDGKDHHEHAPCAEESCRKTGCKRKQKLPEDMEDLVTISNMEEFNRAYNHVSPPVHKGPKSKVTFTLNGVVWHDCHTLEDINFWLPWYSGTGKSVMISVGHLSLAVYKDTKYDVILNCLPCKDFHEVSTDGNGLIIGAGTSITSLIDFLEETIATYKGQPDAYKTGNFEQFAHHLRRVGSKLIRNIGSTVGNLFMSHMNQDGENFFLSDVATIMMGIGAKLHVYDPTNMNTSVIDMTTFYTTDFTGKYVTTVRIPWSLQNEKYMSYKIAIRQVNAHAILNSAMRCVVSNNKVVGQPTIVYGGLYTRPTRITAVETAMIGMDVTDNTAFQALATTISQLKITPYGGRNEFRTSCAVSHIYKFFLFLQPSLPANLQSAVTPWFTRGESSGKQSFQPDPAEFPVSQGMTKLDAIQQTSGTAKYADDLPCPEGTLHASMVITTVGQCTIASIDTSAAEKLPGYVAFYDYKSMNKEVNGWQNGEVFCSGSVQYAGQCVGVVLAETRELAHAASKAIVINYTDMKTNLTSQSEAVKQKSFFNPKMYPPPVVTGDVDSAWSQCQNVVTDSVELGYQYHFHLEDHCTLAVPKEANLEINVCTQEPVEIQQFIAGICQMPSSHVNVNMKRAGGGFGGKITNSQLGAMICGWSSVHTGRPVKLVVTMQQAMQTLGARGGKIMDYKVGFNDDGKLIAFEATVYSTCGRVDLDGSGAAMALAHSLDNCYKIPNVKISSVLVQTDIPAVSPVRGPGWVQAIQLNETMMSRVCRELSGKVTPDVIRSTNFFKKGQHTADGMLLRNWDIPKIWSTLMASSDYAARRTDVDTFNKANTWLKKGLAIMPVRFGVGWGGGNYGCLISIYPDGAVSVSHGGSEIGQGINTKVAQIVAMELGAPLALVNVLETTTRTLSGMSNVTGGSITSELCGLSAIHACQELKSRMAPVFKKGMSWNQWAGAAVGAGVHLTATGWSNTPNPATGIFNYNSTSAAVCEVIVDVLSGEFEILRTDLLFDSGVSLNPVIDIGQIEGGFMFGMGMWTSEELDWDPTTGKATKASTWTYKPPCAFDVPLELNTALLRNSGNPQGVLSSKACGEPGVCLSTCVVQALEDAVSAARLETVEDPKRYVAAVTPFTVAKIQQACGIAINKLTF